MRMHSVGPRQFHFKRKIGFCWLGKEIFHSPCLWQHITIAKICLPPATIVNRHFTRNIRRQSGILRNFMRVVQRYLRLSLEA
ncbi:DUF2431 superfamily domain-containing protein [Histoplasma capsulatum var. duboisii H88]|uniref:DUF2431 superfamily domain-containing protein n=1 Tax=Ajellomyces capsulatus (strain H88) TaxID=544711 RepID=A0A8A1LUR3_AJEC8|nr:DUF2431 superfamily domain-containing protein [Histoplasma capsulatum var. duboisii H88]